MAQLEGSLCGYYNKAFNQRHSKGDNFRSWNSKRTNARGVTIDFGDLQVTYGKGCMFGWKISAETPKTDVAHSALFSLLSDTARKSLLNSAETRQLKLADVVYAPDTENDSSTAAFVIVRSGCLDIYCVACDDGRVQNPAMANGSQSNNAVRNKNTPSSTASVTTIPKDPIVSLSRGQTFGDQMITLGLPNLWASNPRRRCSNIPVRFKVVAGDSSTEVLWVTRDRFEQLLREDHLRLSYNPIYGPTASTTSPASLISAVESRDISQITRQMLTNATLSKFFFQFPPIVLDRLCHHIEMQHYDSNGMFLEAGGSIDNVCIVVTGALHSHRCGSENDRNAAKKSNIHQGNAQRMPFTWDVHFIPSDAFGARELMKRCSSSEAPVFVDAEELFREGDAQRSLVVILNGFVSFYSLENMAATIDMFQRHPFCVFAAFAGSTTNPEDFVAEPRPDKGGSIPSAALNHRAAMHGVHVQTLPPRNAFRTGVLQEYSVCPATVLAQTDCEYLVFDENVYAWLLADHAPAVNMRGYVAPPEPSEIAVTSTSKDSSKPGTQPVSQTPIPQPDNRPGVIPPSLLLFLEGARIPWFSPSTAKRTLLLRSMQHIHLTPGQRLMKQNEVLRHIVFVVSGKLAVYVHDNQEVVSVSNVSQRPVQNTTLEKSVASNYSTTSSILYQERPTSAGLLNRRALQRKIARIVEVDTRGDESNRTSTGSRFTDFVMHAAKEAKNRQGSTTEEIEQVAFVPKAPSTRKSLHSMVNKMKFQRKTEDQNLTNTAVELKESSRTLFMFHLGPGDIYGDEITAPSGVFHCVHDIYAGTSTTTKSGASESGNDRPHMIPMGTEVLCLDRAVLHSIIAKSEEEAATDLIGRSSDAKAKWHVASKKVFKRSGSHSRLDESGEFIRIKKPPKLFDFFKNILNQRRFLTMGTLAHFPRLRDLPEDSRRELCLNARFEALDRYTDAFKGNGDNNGLCNRFFLLLTGRINLVANGPNSHTVFQNTNSSTTDPDLREICAGEGFGEFEILMSEAPTYTAAIAAEPTKLLSIPTDMYLKHWPCIHETRGNIEYLRAQIPSFASLDLERIAYLYHSFSFQTHARGTIIFQLHDTTQGPAARNEVYFIKEGTCCIRQYVTLTSHLDTELRNDSNNNEPPQKAKIMKTIKILATVADVRAGHIFWVDNDEYPIGLVATSAAVTIASISIDKLKAIVPRGQLTGIEELSGQLRNIYGKQFELAKRVTATVMNEKLATHTRGPQLNQRLPTLHPRGQNVPLEDEHIFQGGTEEQQLQDDIDTNANNNAASDMMNAIYDAQHQIERYDISNEIHEA
ncbi:hypothetical protein PHMEG_0009862 [Phytophthora megakarya]|uniref:Cyclic nucleotide-binding domain-containing protein n=1 Tax=Phytophthora megakarya TaxID=4795 RepID=A0A225WF49_9STRA|nr:hypothetical protein PHMEG_0009862 [Phytophthora megakarya]